MTLIKFRGFCLAMVFGVGLANAAGLTFTCDKTLSGNPDNYAAGTCSYLNNTIAGLYNSTFNNINANIYIKQGITGLGGSDTPEYYVSYSDYLNAVTGSASGDGVDTGALAALHSLDAAVYGSNKVMVTSALASALGITGSQALPGLTSSFAPCSLGVDPDCYSGVIVVTTPANLNSETGQSLYYRQLGGSQSNAYDYYSVVEHETDEILGTISCVSTQTGGKLTDPCDSGSPTGTPSANDLFRYNSVGNLARNNAYLTLHQAPVGAYFSWNGGATNGASGALFNTIANGSDYADFTNTCIYIQDGSGCTGVSLDITTDGRGEINMLDAVGYNIAAPEPGTMLLFGTALAGFGMIRGRRA